MASTPETRLSSTTPVTSLRQTVWLLALPAVGEQVLNTLVGLSDTFLVGHLSPAASARVGYSSSTALV